MNELLVVSSSPHIRGSLTVRKIMMDVTIALLPAGIMGVYFYGWHALLIMVLSVASAVLTEAVIQKLMKKPVTVNDFSAVVTGLLLAYNVPPTAPWWLPVVGSAFAIAIVKQCFGGLGHNFVNPALAGRAFLLVSWPVLMTNFVAPGLDAVASATPLALMKSGAVEQLPSLWNLFIGNIGGCIGETSALAILIGAAYLVAARLIDIRIPLSFIGTTALLTWIFGGQAGMFTGMPLHHILMGGAHAGRLLYGYRLYHFSGVPQGSHRLWHRMWRDHFGDPDLGRLSRRRFLQHPYHEHRGSAFGPFHETQSLWGGEKPWVSPFAW